MSTEDTPLSSTESDTAGQEPAPQTDDSQLPAGARAEPGAEEEAPELSPADQFTVHWIGPEGDEEAGPLHVLWTLIESYRVDIFDVSLNRITDDFLMFMSLAADLKIEHASTFAVMAARLLYHKSRALLPDPGYEDEEPEARLPPELIQQLLEYRKFQMAAERLRDLGELTRGMLERPTEVVPSEEASDEWLDVSLVDLVRAYAEVLQRTGDDPTEEEAGFQIALEEWSVEEKVEEIRRLLSEAVSFAFEDLFKNAEDMTRGEVIAVFLALLELCKSAEIVIQQRGTFGEIVIFRKSAVVR